MAGGDCKCETEASLEDLSDRLDYVVRSRPILQATRRPTKHLVSVTGESKLRESNGRKQSVGLERHSVASLSVLA